MTKKNYLWQVCTLSRRDGKRYATFYRRNNWSKTYIPTDASWNRVTRAICGRFGYRSLNHESIRVFPATPC